MQILSNNHSFGLQQRECGGLCEGTALSQHRSRSVEVGEAVFICSERTFGSPAIPEVLRGQPTEHFVSGNIMNLCQAEMRIRNYCSWGENWVPT